MITAPRSVMTAANPPHTRDPIDYFSDPLDPQRSLQLNNRYWQDETFRHLDILREADDDVEHSRFVSLRKTLKPVKALLPARYHRSFLSRLVYSIVYRVSFEPVRFNLKLSKPFLEANAYKGAASEAAWPAQCVEELKHIVDLAHSIFRDKYGRDVLSSEFGLRYMNAANPASHTRMTKYGDFSDYHLDAGKDFTCIIYLCRVSRDNGCFTYIDGTNSIRKSHLLRALHQVVGVDMGLQFPDETSSLPLELRGSMGIGNYLDDAKRDVLRDSCVEFLGDVGDGIIFNGFDTMHRGGKPLAGERTSLFISTTGRVQTRARKLACELMAYLWL